MDQLTLNTILETSMINLSKKSKFGLNCTNMSGTLRDELALCSEWTVGGVQYVGERAAQKAVG